MFFVVDAVDVVDRQRSDDLHLDAGPDFTIWSHALQDERQTLSQKGLRKEEKSLTSVQLNTHISSYVGIVGATTT